MKRIYIMSDNKGNFYKLPYMQYPEPIKKFVTWLKKKKIISQSNYFIWNADNLNDVFFRDGSLDVYYNEFNHGYLVKNLMTDQDLDEYNKFIKSEQYINGIKIMENGDVTSQPKKCQNVCTDDIPVQEVAVTQELIDEYIGQQPQLKRLYWKTDKDKIMEVLQTLNHKYLLGRLEAHEKEATETHLGEDDIKRIENEGIKHRKYSVTVKYSGYIFNIDKKTLEKEAWRRVEKEEMFARYDMLLWKSSSRGVRFGYLVKKNGQEYIQYMKHFIPVSD